MSTKPIPLQNPSSAAYMRIQGADVTFNENEGPDGRPIVDVTAPGGSGGIIGQKTIPLAEGLNVLEENEYKYSMLLLTDDSIVVAATVELPAVDTEAESYYRIIRNETAFNITIQTDDGTFVIDAGLSYLLTFNPGGIDSATVSDIDWVAALAAETAAREAADTALQGEIDAEEIARAAADTALQNELDATQVRVAIMEKMTSGCRLTLSSTIPVTTDDLSVQGTLYLLPYLNSLVPVYDGATWTLLDIGASKSISLNGISNATNYDIFLKADGTLRIGDPWTNDSTRDSSLSLQNGILVGGEDTYLGTIRGSGANVCADSTTQRFVWNYYNRVPRTMRKIPPTNTTSTGTAAGTFRAYLNDTGNCVEYVNGMAGLDVMVEGQGMARHTASDFGMGIGLGDNVTNADTSSTKNGSYTYANMYTFPQARYRGVSSLGYHKWTLLEISSVAGTFYSDNNFPDYHQAGILARIDG